MHAAGAKFAYYKKLPPAQKRIYDLSDRLTVVKLPAPERFYPLVSTLEKRLAADDQAGTKGAAQELMRALCDAFRIPRVSVKVLARRPASGGGELHGLYVAEEGATPVVTLWMRTAKRKQVVAFRTFLRTLLHEFLHHLDFAHLKMRESYHTEGFYKRESSLARALLGEPRSGDRPTGGSQQQ